MEKEVKVFKALSHSIRLKILKEAGILKSRKKGMWTYYSISNIKILDIINLIENLDV